MLPLSSCFRQKDLVSTTDSCSVPRGKLRTLSDWMSSPEKFRTIYISFFFSFLFLVVFTLWDCKYYFCFFFLYWTTNIKQPVAFGCVLFAVRGESRQRRTIFAFSPRCCRGISFRFSTNRGPPFAWSIFYIPLEPDRHTRERVLVGERRLNSIENAF